MLLHADGFGSYGTDTANMIRGVYATVSSRVSLQTTPLRSTLLTHCIRAQSTSGGPDNGTIRKVLDNPETELITGCAVRVESAPSNDTENGIISFHDSTNTVQCTLKIGTNLDLIMALGGLNSTTDIARSASNVISALTYQFVEVYARAGEAGSPGGAIEVRVNGETVIDVTGVDTTATANINFQSVYLAPNGGSGSVTCYYQDWYINDLSGTVNNDFLGDTQWVTLFPDADGPTQEWVPNLTGDAYLTINEATPDDDTSYISSDTAGEKSDFGVEDVPAVTSTISAILTRTLARKEDAGAANLQPSVISAEASPETIVNGADVALTETYQVYTDVFEVDPATGVAWTPSGANGIRVQVDHTA